MDGSLSGIERLSTNIREFIEQNMDNCLFFPDISREDPKRLLPFTDRQPVYDYEFQILNEVRGVPTLPIRCNFHFGLRRSASIESELQKDKLFVIRDQFHKLLRSVKASNTLQWRQLRLLNSSFNVRRNLYLLLTQFEFSIFLKKGEY